MRKYGLKRYPQHDPPAAPVVAKWLAPIALFALTLLAMGGVFIVLLPFLQPIIIGVLLAGLFAPVHTVILTKLKQRRNLASLLSVALVFLLVVVPLGIFTSALVRQGVSTYQAANAWIEDGKLEAALKSERVERILDHALIVRLREFISERFEIDTANDLNLDNSHVGGFAMSASEWIIQFLGAKIMPMLKTVIAATGDFFFKFFIMLFVMFFAFRDGASLLGYIRHISPLSGSQETALFERIKGVSRAVFLGTFVTALAQGLTAMAAFKICGIPALFWGTVLGAASIVPAVGTALVWVPATIYLFLIGRWQFAIFLALWCMLVVGSIDNFVRPVLMGGRVGMSSVVVFFAILGGLRLFGPAGLIYGPLIFGICAVCFYIYELENSEFLSRQDRR